MLHQNCPETSTWLDLFMSNILLWFDNCLELQFDRLRPGTSGENNYQNQILMSSLITCNCRPRLLSTQTVKLLMMPLHMLLLVFKCWTMTGEAAHPSSQSWFQCQIVNYKTSASCSSSSVFMTYNSPPDKEVIFVALWDPLLLRSINISR